MTQRSLADVMNATPDLVAQLRNSPIGAYVYPVVAPEFSNWRSEQRAWRQTAVLFDQSHHMAEILVEGPDATALLSRLAINSFANFPVERAKHFVPVSPSGHVIGDLICFREDERRYNLVGRAPAVNWIEYHARTGGWDVTANRDDRSPARPMGRPVTRRHYRFQVQGPNAPKILERVNGGPLPELSFFHMGRINVGKRRARALRHGMAGVAGLELWGPYEEGDEVRAALLEAGADLGLMQVGARAYATNTLESGWIPSPLPAVYTDPEMADYRAWLGADSYEATCSVGGSFVAERVEDYYLTPYELGYGIYARFDHDFIGRAALESMKDRPHRRKVTFEWNGDDLARVLGAITDRDQPHAKVFDLPLANYASSSFDRVMMGERMVGLSMFTGYSHNERCGLSLGIVDPDVKEGDVLTLVWGEEDGGTAKTTVEPHVQTELRVKVAPAPYSRDAREGYAPASWRARVA